MERQPYYKNVSNWRWFIFNNQTQQSTIRGLELVFNEPAIQLVKQQINMEDVQPSAIMGASITPVMCMADETRGF